MKSKAIILLSGGLDSTTAFAIAKQQGFACYALSVDYGQKHRVELAASRKIACNLGAIEHKIIQLSIAQLSRSALTDANIAVPNYSAEKKITTTYVPARNTLFLSVALGWAEVVEADAIFVGMNADDYNGFPDCRPEYFAAFQQMANLATKRGVEAKPVRIETPLITLNKAQIIQRGHALGIDYRDTVTCYQANSEGLACGRCDSCVVRQQGFAQAGVDDPTKYV